MSKKEKKPVLPQPAPPVKGVAVKDKKKKVPEISSYAEPNKIKIVLRKKKKKKGVDTGDSEVSYT
jgi:hypothetical protein